MATTKRVVSVKFLGALRQLARCRDVSLVVDADATVGDVLETLATTHGPAFRQAIFRIPGEVHTYLRVFVDEEEAGVNDRVAPGAAAVEVALLVMPGFEGGL